MSRTLWIQIGNSAYSIKTLCEDVYFTEKKLIASQFRSGAKKSQAALCSWIGNCSKHSGTPARIAKGWLCTFVQK